jgi:hypothetical protein
LHHYLHLKQRREEYMDEGIKVAGEEYTREFYKIQDQGWLARLRSLTGFEPQNILRVVVAIDQLTDSIMGILLAHNELLTVLVDEARLLDEMFDLAYVGAQLILEAGANDQFDIPRLWEEANIPCEEYHNKY